MADDEKVPPSLKGDTGEGVKDDFVLPDAPPAPRAATHRDARKQPLSSDAVENVEVAPQQVNRFPESRGPLNVHDPKSSSAEATEDHASNGSSQTDSATPNKSTAPGKQHLSSDASAANRSEAVTSTAQTSYSKKKQGIKHPVILIAPVILIWVSFFLLRSYYSVDTESSSPNNTTNLTRRSTHASGLPTNPQPDEKISQSGENVRDTLRPKILPPSIPTPPPAESGGRFAPASDIQSLNRQAVSGDAEAQFKLGVAYAEGDGVPVDRTTVLAWYTKAAEQGHVTAQFYLGRMYATGDGVSKDFTQAEFWLRRAATTGQSKEARECLARLENEMSSTRTTLTGMRTWTDKDGRVLTAELLSVFKNSDGYYEGLFQRPDGTEFSYQIGNMSTSDVDLVRRLIQK